VKTFVGAEGSKDSVKEVEVLSDVATRRRLEAVVLSKTTKTVRRRTMNSHKASAIIFCCALACAAFEPTAKADQWNQMTKIEFSEPIEIPGQVLPAGTYWFVLLDSASDRDVVQIFSGDWSKLEATLRTVPSIREQPTDDTEIELAERPHQQPEAILKWYYPGLLTGHEFVYSSKQEKQFAREEKRDVLAELVP
jgi:hypothetical protein